MSRVEIIKELENRGFMASAQDYESKGMEMEGIRVGRAGNKVTIMVGMKKSEAKDWDNLDLVDGIIEEYLEKAESGYVERITDREYVKNHIFIGLQREDKPTENVIKSPSGLDGIEAYLYLDTDGETLRIAENFLEKAGIEKREAWKMAEKNTFAETIILTPGMVLAQIAGLSYNPVLEEAPGPKFFAVTNTKRYKGAASILNLDLIKEKVGKRFVVLPSSIHEMLLVPVAENEEVDLESYTQTVREANDTFEPEIILSDRAYLLEL